MESEMKNVLEELDYHKNKNNRMHDEIARLELGLEHNKVIAITTYFWYLISSFILLGLLNTKSWL